MSETTATRPTTGTNDAGDRPLSEIMASLGHDVTQLVQAQLDLAKVELKDEARQLGRAGAMGGAAVVAALCALLLLGMAAAWAIAEAWPTWSGFLIVGGIYAAAAIAFAVSARQRLEPISEGPVETIETLQEDAQWLRQHRS
jgi:uncharacterized membrane protein YqjE